MGMDQSIVVALGLAVVLKKIGINSSLLTQVPLASLTAATASASTEPKRRAAAPPRETLLARPATFAPSTLSRTTAYAVRLCPPFNHCQRWQSERPGTPHGKCCSAASRENPDLTITKAEL